MSCKIKILGYGLVTKQTLDERHFFIFILNSSNTKYLPPKERFDKVISMRLKHHAGTQEKSINIIKIRFIIINR